MDKSTIAFMRDIADGIIEGGHAITDEYCRMGKNNVPHMPLLVLSRGIMRYIAMAIRNACDRAEKRLA